MKERFKLSFDKLLQIDTTSRDKIILGLIGKEIKTKVFETQKQSENLLSQLEKFLSEENNQLSDLNAILVNIGPGSYTGTRIGVTIANTLAWSLDIPVFGYNEETLSVVLKKTQESSNSANFQQIVLPYYQDENRLN